MKKISALSLLLALSAATTEATNFAEVASQLPECSLECIQEAAEKFDCQVVDFECQCGKMEEITNEVSPCMVTAGCGMEDITDVATMVADICADQVQDKILVNDDEGDDDEDIEADETNEDETDAAAGLQNVNVFRAVVLVALAVALS